MKKILTIPFLALLFLPFCSNKRVEHKHVAISTAEISLAVQLDVLQFACERRLSALEAQVYAPKKKVPHAPILDAVKASDPIHQ